MAAARSRLVATGRRVGPDRVRRRVPAVSCSEDPLARIRLPIALVLACAVTIGMFWTLRTLIGVTGAIGEIRSAPKIEVVRLRRDTQVEEKRRVKPSFEKPQATPSAPDVVASQKASVMPGADLAALAPSVDFSGVGGGGLGGSGGGGGGLALASGTGSDRDAVPQVRIQPDYPIQARQKGIEGWVDVQFTVGTDGSVRNPVVVDAQPKSIFDSAAIQAVRGWKYSPKTQDGRPVEQAGMRVRIRFELES
jgi:protein TonB